MPTMSTLSLREFGLAPAQVRAVEKRARQQGKSPTEYVRSLVERDLVAASSFDDILRPIRAGFANSGVTRCASQVRYSAGTYARRAYSCW